MLASFATRVSSGVRRALVDAEAHGLRGDSARGLDLLRDVAAGLAPGADDDRVALGEMAMVIASWAGQVTRAAEFVEDQAGHVVAPRARGALYFHLGRASVSAEARDDYLRKALDEFTVAGDLR